MRNCKDCIFWPVCEDWSKDYYSMLGGSNPFPLEGDILDECQLYKSNKLYEIKKKVKMPNIKTIKSDAYREFAAKALENIQRNEGLYAGQMLPRMWASFAIDNTLDELEEINNGKI